MLVAWAWKSLKDWIFLFQKVKLNVSWLKMQFVIESLKAFSDPVIIINALLHFPQKNAFLTKLIWITIIGLWLQEEGGSSCQKFVSTIQP